LINILLAITVGKIIETILECLLALLIIIMVINTFRIKKTAINNKKDIVELDNKKLKNHLIKAIQIPTISPISLEEDTTAFDKFEKFLEESYPLVHKYCEKTVINTHALLFKVSASEKTELLPIGFLAHQDVVPAEPKGWDYPPFSGEVVIEDGVEYIYGRGAIDMKVHLLATMEAVEHLISVGHKFNRDVYLCFGFDEELSGRLGAFQIVNYLKEKNITLEFIVDEGGVVLDGSMLGIDGKVALIGNSEKGYADFTLTATKDGGHSSSPIHPTSIEVLAKGITKLEKHRFPTRWTPSTIELFEELTPFMKPGYKFVCANRKIFSPILKYVLCKVNPAVAAILRTTLSPTIMSGSAGFNIIGREACVNINCRMLPGDTKDSVLKYIQKIVGKDIEVTWQPITCYDPPSKISSAHTDSFQTIAKAISLSFDKLVPAPFPFIAGSDAKFYYPVAKNVYRFSPYPISEEDTTRIHSANERMATANLAPAVNFFINLIKIS